MGKTKYWLRQLANMNTLRHAASKDRPGLFIGGSTTAIFHDDRPNGLIQHPKNDNNINKTGQ